METAKTFYSAHRRRQRKIEKYFRPKIKKELASQINEFIEAADRRGAKWAYDNIDSIISFVGIAGVVKEIYLKSSLIEANGVLKLLAKPPKKRVRKSLQFKKGPAIGDLEPVLGLTLDEIAPTIEEYFKIRLLNDSAIPITEYTKKQIKKYLADEVDKGLTYEEAVANFKQVAVSWTGREGKADRRAKKIATTESTRAMSFGGLIGAYMSGVDCDKIWVTSDDERVRGTFSYAPFPHVHLDLNRANLNDPFYNGERIKFPGDPEASPSNTVECRCALYYEEKPKPKPRVRRSMSGFLTFFSNLFSLGAQLLSNVLGESIGSEGNSGKD